MAHVWSRNARGSWVPAPLDGDSVDLAVVGFAGPAAVGGSLVRLSTSPGSWAIVGAAGPVRVNGAPLPLGIAVLDDRDELFADGSAGYFSTETRPEIVPCVAARGVCPRCKRPITAGAPAVRCPGCGVWYHEDPSSESCCWSYAGRCSCCEHATAIDAGFQWTPEEL